MPIIKRNRKAKPFHVWRAYLERPNFPEPRKHETFKEYLVRLEGSSDYVLRLLTTIGYGEPSQREYLYRLGEVRQLLYAVNNELHALWPN